MEIKQNIKNVLTCEILQILKNYLHSYRLATSPRLIFAEKRENFGHDLNSFYKFCLYAIVFIC